MHPVVAPVKTSLKIIAGIFSKHAVRMAAGDAPGKGGNVIDRPNVLPGEEVK